MSRAGCSYSSGFETRQRTMNWPPARRLSLTKAVPVLLVQLVLGCIITGDEPDPPSQDTGASDPDCNQAFQDALDAGLCQPPAELVLNFDLGSTNYIYVDDPYFEAIGAIGIFGAVGAGADSVARVIESNGTCEILCSYDIVTCNDEAPICLSFSSGCLYCNDPNVTIEQCESFLSACAPEEATGTSSSGESGDSSADSTSR